MPVKLLAFDLDGTALSDHKYLSPENRRALESAGQAGVLLVPATGRIRSFLPKEITALPHLRYAITSNGGALCDLLSPTPLHTALLAPETALQVQKILDEYPLYIEYYANGVPYTQKCDIEEAKRVFGLPESKHHFLTKSYSYISSYQAFLLDGNSVEKINLPYLPSSIRSEVRLRLSRIPGIKLTSSIPDNLEVNHADATKGKALSALCGHLGLSPQACMAIGDNGNDTDMLALAGVSVAMGNASPEALAAAKFRTADCEQNGLALAIKRHILDKL